MLYAETQQRDAHMGTTTHWRSGGEATPQMRDDAEIAGPHTRTNRQQETRGGSGRRRGSVTRLLSHPANSAARENCDTDDSCDDGVRHWIGGGDARGMRAQSRGVADRVVQENMEKPTTEVQPGAG